MIGLLETTVLALGLSYVGFDLYFFGATFYWTQRLRRVNRSALMLSGFREVLDFVFQGPVPGFVDQLTEPSSGTERAGRLVIEAYPELRDQLRITHEKFDLPQRLQLLEKEVGTLRWISVLIAAVMAALVALATLIPLGFEVLVVAVLVNSVVMLPFATTWAEVGMSLRESEQILEHLRGAHSGAPIATTPSPPGHR
jgi:hypothetical protein